MNLFDILLAKKLGGGGSKLGARSITANGTYSASDDDLDGYSEVSVNVQPSDGFVLSDFNASGYPTTMTVHRNGVMPKNYCYGIGSSLQAVSATKYVDKILLADGITSVGETAFYMCSLIEELTFPESVSSVGSSIVNYCPSCKKLTFLGDVELTWSCLYQNSFTLEQIICKGQVTIRGSLAGNSYTGSKISLYDFSGCRSIPTLSQANYLFYADGCTIKIPYALSDQALGVGNGWESATNWSALQNVVWEAVQ